MRAAFLTPTGFEIREIEVPACGAQVTAPTIAYLMAAIVDARARIGMC